MLYAGHFAYIGAAVVISSAFADAVNDNCSDKANLFSGLGIAADYEFVLGLGIFGHEVEYVLKHRKKTHRSFGGTDEVQCDSLLPSLLPD